MTGAALLAVRGLTRTPWFADFQLELPAREVRVLRGPSGSGKTLLLRALADLDPADRGEVRLDGRERASLAPGEWRARVLYLHQTPVRLPGTVADNVERVRSLRVRSAPHAPSAPSAPGAPGRSGAAGAPAVLERTGISPEADMETLSGGEAQLVALHRALALAPRVLLLDEATSALDEDRAREAEAAVLDWVRAGGAALWASHDPALAARLEAPEVRLA